MNAKSTLLLTLFFGCLFISLTNAQNPSGLTLVQNENLNLQKYWAYRNKFRSQFVRIGAGQGEGINVANIDGQPNNASLFINV
ncbi:MAG: hypothetical protein IPP56_07595 [Bacteroidetes bacterium]|nr:hypothetical protein [Bacteroidota bacterium]MBK9673125.1 hypothetical protein [Bacteroidota bacterium]MBK9799582.1 hypothetical protein [Bacteroidota bacterium]MBP6412714.1 hypothetical protein [Bacteroidia bacterium]